jgi:hypothetical protein
MGALHDAVTAATSENERKRIKAQAWVDQDLSEGWNFNYRGYKVELTAALDLVNDNVVFQAKLSQGGTDYTPPDLNPITIVNPPYLVEDPGGDIVLTWTDADGVEQQTLCKEDVAARIVSQLQDIGDKVIDAL